MKKYVSILFFIFLLSIVGVFLLFGKDYFANDEPKLNYELIKGETSDKELRFIYIAQNTGDSNVKLKFLTDVEVDYTLSESIQTDKNTNKNLKNQANKKVKGKGGRTITLTPGEKYKHEILINTENLQPGEYDLKVRLATEDINTPESHIIFTQN